MEHVLIAIIVFISGVVTVLLSWVGSRRFHIGPQQELLVETLQDVIAAQNERLKLLEANLQVQLKKVEELTKQVVELEARIKETEKVLIDQEKELHKFENKQY